MRIYSELLIKFINETRDRVADNIPNMNISSWVLKLVDVKEIDLGTDKNSKGLLLNLVKSEALFLALQTMYLVEKSFSVVLVLQSKQIQNLMVATRGDLRLMVS